LGVISLLFVRLIRVYLDASLTIGMWVSEGIMAEQPFGFWALLQILEDHTHLGEALLFPDITRYGANLDRLYETLQRNVRAQVEYLPLADLHRRRRPGPGHGPRWESKCSGWLRIQHGLVKMGGGSL
jgi:hypothetical protein